MRQLTVALVALVALVVLLAAASVHAGYVNFETGHVHPVALTPSGERLLVVNTPDALLEVFTVQPDGSLVHDRAIPVGLEPVTVAPRTENEAWVVNNLSDSISIVDLDLGLVAETLWVGDEPTDVAFAAGKAFVAVSSEDAVKVYTLPALLQAAVVPLFSRDVRALAVSPDGTQVYAVTLRSGNQTTTINANVVHGLSLKAPLAPPGEELHEGFYELFDQFDRPGCSGIAPEPPPLPQGVQRNPALIDPLDGVPKNSIIVRWSQATNSWRDEAGTNWSSCVAFQLPDRDLFIIDATTLNVTDVPHLGTTLFDVSVNPANGRIYVSNTDARNFVRFEHTLGLRGRAVDNRLSVVDPADSNARTVIQLNGHVDLASEPETNLAERQASISQPGMMAWKSDGSAAFLTGIGSHKVFRVDGECMSRSCIFGPDRAQPVAVESGLGPTGVALREASEGRVERLYVLNRIAHSVSIVDPQAMSLLEEIPLHDPSSEATRSGRVFLYDALGTSAHGDASCASCHPFGDMDGLAWELGNPERSLVSYDVPLDNVAFVHPGGEQVPGLSDEACDPGFPLCADHRGFDPQKGPMVTQTLRGMLEPLHWRGDRPTFRDFNQTFVDLLGSSNIAPPPATAAGLPDEAMELFRQFALEIRLPPNPHRNVDDSLPCGLRAEDPDCQVRVYGNNLWGNPTEGEDQFLHGLVWGGARQCTQCHGEPFGTFGGTLGGVEPSEPVSAQVTRLHTGATLTEFPGRHSDVEVPHLRNLYEKFGGTPPTGGFARAGFGYLHDGSIPDLAVLMTNRLFSLQPDNAWQRLRDVTAFLFAFPTGTKPSVGRQVTLPAGTPPTGSASSESLLVTLMSLGDIDDGGRHCELSATTIVAGVRRGYAYSGGVWLTDVQGEAPLSTEQLREFASAPVTFTCGTLDAGLRLGVDRDEDGALNGDDCAPADPSTLAAAQPVATLALESSALTWDDQSAAVGVSVRYDVLTADLSALLVAGVDAISCLAAGSPSPGYVDTRPAPAVGDGYLYLIRATNPCGTADLGPGRETATNLACP